MLFKNSCELQFWVKYGMAVLLLSSKGSTLVIQHWFFAPGPALSDAGEHRRGRAGVLHPWGDWQRPASH